MLAGGSWELKVESEKLEKLGRRTPNALKGLSLFYLRVERVVARFSSLPVRRLKPTVNKVSSLQD
jgi:hypothetical protein